MKIMCVNCGSPNLDTAVTCYDCGKPPAKKEPVKKEIAKDKAPAK